MKCHRWDRDTRHRCSQSYCQCEARRRVLTSDAAAGRSQWQTLDFSCSQALGTGRVLNVEDDVSWMQVSRGRLRSDKVRLTVRPTDSLAPCHIHDKEVPSILILLTCDAALV